MRQPQENSSRLRPSRVRDLGGGGSWLLAVALASCTLTQDDFEPALTESGPLEPGQDAGSAPVAPPPPVAAPPGAACSVAIACPAGFECRGDVCVQSACPGSEDPAACAPSLCADGSCGPGTCTDGLRAPDEADVDCGGPCAPCASGAECGSGVDCASGVCSGGRCAEPSCSDGLNNQDESGSDCGGGVCAPCAVGTTCRSSADCDSGAFCSPAQLCAAQSCQNGLRDGTESGVDCGGGCAGCAPGIACSAGVDCQSGVCGGEGCAAGLAGCCQAPSCEDGVQNGTESGLDCGRGCSACSLGATCVAGGDCATNVCSGGVCATLCGDGERDGDESGVDCGGSESGCPACPRCDEQNSVDLGAVASQTTLPGNACAIITNFPGYAPTLLDSSDDGPYPITVSWRQACSGQAGSVVFSAAFQLLPLAGLGTACPVILDLGGSPEPFSLIWY